MAKALAAARVGFRRLLSISAFTPPPPATVPPPAEPSPNLFVSGLSKRTTSEGLREAFMKFGNVIQARVVTDRVSGYSKGFGFVRYATVEEAAEGIKGMDGKFLDGWVIFAEYAKPRPPPPSQAQSSESPPAPPSNYMSQTSQSWTSYQSSQTLQTRPINNSVPPSNYSSETSPPPSAYSQASKSQLGYASGPPIGYNPQASQPPNFPPSTSVNTENSSIQPSGNQTSDTKSSS
ncbi:RNA binding motif protein, X-linked-like-1 [Phalaenopsis equestris]|uniref:RNA binding motif protein, X-linked-like-1 n=1 Tax=Phalaenopsis equestris TaxID=78828 RepID=UPI0009E51BF3|nr:RNA binding motif protein, X-linked-like-1 [Phalaenopsis equestris]